MQTAWKGEERGGGVRQGAERGQLASSDLSYMDLDKQFSKPMFKQFSKPMFAMPHAQGRRDTTQPRPAFLFDSIKQIRDTYPPAI